ncbi:hypothetical protein [Nocardia sp. NPDC004722]
MGLLKPGDFGRGVRRGVLPAVRIVLGVGIFVVAVVSFAGQAVRAAGAGHYAKTGLIVVWAVAVVTLLALAFVVTFFYGRYGWSAGAVVGDSADGRATILLRARVGALAYVLFPAWAGALGWYGIAKVTGHLPWTDPPLLRPAGFGFVAIAAAAYPLLISVEYLRGGYKPLRITLSGSGIRYREATGETFVPWGQVTGVDVSSPGRRESATPTITIHYAEGPTVRHHRSTWIGGKQHSNQQAALRIAPAAFDIGAPRLIRALEFYAAHPESRAELGTDASLARIIG